MEKRLAKTLLDGYTAILESQALEEGIAGKALTIGALVAGTLFSGCAGNAPKSVPALDLPPDAPVTDTTVNQLAIDIANQIIDEMDTASSVESTAAAQSANDIYKKLEAGNHKALANMFARTIKQRTKLWFTGSPTYDGRTYNNRESEAPKPSATYNTETGTWEYN